MSNFSTLEESIRWIAAESGRNPERDRADIIDSINDARRLFYTVYQRVHLDFYIEGCVAVQKFCEQCNNCPDTYLGITLPAEVEQVEALWTGCAPVPLYDKWVEYRTFVRGKDSCLTKGIDKGGDHPTQADIPCGKCAKLKFTATDKADCGKIITVRYFDASKEERIEHIALSLDGLCIEGVASSIAKPGGIVLPVGVVGGVIIQDSNSGLRLGSLNPKITVPSFRRLKLTGVCEGELVAFRATRKFTELYWNWDVVEVGGEQKLALIEAYRYNKLIGTGSGDPAWTAKAKLHLDNLTQYIAGSNMRSDGATVTRRIDLFPHGWRDGNRLIKNRR